MEMTTAKTVAVFAIIVGCFLVLYPKIFHPMIMHIFGMAPAKRPGDDMSNRMPPHLRHAMASGKRSVREDMPSQMRAGAHPGMRAAAEMKKAAMQQSTTGDKGMMGVVLPMYAVGIVLYLIYTLTKVFNRKDKSETAASSSGDYLSNHFSDMRPGASTGGVTMTTERKVMQKQKELEKLLMKAESEEINDDEMTELKRRLLETEAQMSRILQAMEAVQQKEGDGTVDSPDSAGIEELNAEATGGIGANNAQVYDEELEFQDDDSDGSVEELDLGDVDQGEEDEEDGISPPRHQANEFERMCEYLHPVVSNITLTVWRMSSANCQRITTLRNL